MDYLSLFRMPTPLKITGRSSSITNAFINSIIPTVPPKASEVRKALEVLEMSPKTFQCAYCGGAATEWDHLRPLVRDRMPTGYISEIHNLVPSCGKCNQSKGNKDWKTWMLSSATLSPSTRGIPDLAKRIKRLEKYEKWSNPTRLDLAAVVGKTLWTRHWNNWKRVQSVMKEAQGLATQINAKVAIAYKASSGATNSRG